MKFYRVSEIFRTIQSEGAKAGISAVFVRFGGCGKYREHHQVTAKEILADIAEISGGCRRVVLVGCEPMAQADNDLLADLCDAGYALTLETNGSIFAPSFLDWLVWVYRGDVKPQNTFYDEIRVTIVNGQEPPESVLKHPSTQYVLSPAFDGMKPNADNIEWAIKKCLEDSRWRLSIQMHKVVRMTWRSAQRYTK